MLNNANGTNRRKVIFLLTDGAPNMSEVPLSGHSDSSIYYDKLRIDSNHPSPPPIYDGSLTYSGRYWGLQKESLMVKDILRYINLRESR